MPASMRFDLARRCARGWAWLAALLLGLALSSAATAHQASDAYLFFSPQGEGTALRWDIALRDLDLLLPVDADGNREITWAEVQAAEPAIDRLALGALQVAGCRFTVGGHALERRSDGSYVVLQLSAPCRVDAGSEMRYGLLFGIDATHRGVARITAADGTVTARALVPQAGLDAAASGHAAPDAGFFAQGVHHIVTGYDHLLFLLCLLLPAVLRRDGGRWQPVAGWREALLPVAGIVTLFTIAHSLTLALAALGWVQLSPRFVEPAIAVTIVVAALDNLRPLFGRRRGLITFLFGLVHGFGFAGVLAELHLPPAQFGWALLQFNLGLEAGQLGVVALVVPTLYLLRERRRYVPGVVVAGSCAAIVVAGLWLVERTAELSLLPF